MKEISQGRYFLIVLLHVFGAVFTLGCSKGNNPTNKRSSIALSNEPHKPLAIENAPQIVPEKVSPKKLQTSTALVIKPTVEQPRDSTQKELKFQEVGVQKDHPKDEEEEKEVTEIPSPNTPLVPNEEVIEKTTDEHSSRREGEPPSPAPQRIKEPSGEENPVITPHNSKEREENKSALLLTSKKTSKSMVAHINHHQKLFKNWIQKHTSPLRKTFSIKGKQLSEIERKRKKTKHYVNTQFKKVMSIYESIKKEMKKVKYDRVDAAKLNRLLLAYHYTLDALTVGNVIITELNALLDELKNEPFNLSAINKRIGFVHPVFEELINRKKDILRVLGQSPLNNQDRGLLEGIDSGQLKKIRLIDYYAEKSGNNNQSVKTLYYAKKTEKEKHTFYHKVKSEIRLWADLEKLLHLWEEMATEGTSKSSSKNRTHQKAQDSFGELKKRHDLKYRLRHTIKSFIQQ